MGRTRSRSYSPPRRDRSRSPTRRRSRRNDEGARRKPFWKGRDLGPRYSSAPTSLLVRNISRDSRPEDLRMPFERFGPVKDVYLPKDYYSGEPRGFGFVQYLDPADASDAQYHMDRQVLAGREITVVFAEENRKKPSEMRVKERSSTPTGHGSRGHSSGGRGSGFTGDGSQRRSPGRRFKSSSRSRSPPSRRHTSREHGGGRERHHRHGASPPRSPVRRSSSPNGPIKGAHKSISRSLSPRARSSASKSASLD